MVSDPELSKMLPFEVVVPEALELVIVQWPDKFIDGMTVPPPPQPDKNIASIRNKTTKKYFLFISKSP